MNPLIGMDLGTTHSLVALFEADGARVLADPKGRVLLPSMVAVDADDVLLVGHAARSRGVSAPTSAVARFKPDMGQDRPVRLGSHLLNPVSLSALVLRSLREQAELALGCAVQDVVITVPAWFREAGRRATVEAARLAGLRVRRLLNEPTAAALGYGVGLSPDVEKTVAVLDLGGGTFDITLLELYDGMVDVRASNGDVHLGGEDYTDAMMTLLKHAGTSGAVRLLAEQAKRSLSDQRDVTIDLTRHGGGEQVITSDAFAEVTQPLDRRLRRCMQAALLQSGLRAPDIDEVLLVGGAARMPSLASLARSVFETEPRRADDVDTLVARGAATQAALLARHEAVYERMVTDVLTHSLGMAVVKEWGGHRYEGRMDILLSRGTTLPVSRENTYYTVHPAQPQITVEVFEGEARVAEDNEKIGTLCVDGLPTHPVDSQQFEAVRIRYSHDVSGILRVDATVVSTGATHQLVVERTARELSEGELREATQRLNEIAVHPRDVQQNAEVLTLASALLELVSQQDRGQLDQEILRLEAALDGQQPEHIATVRQELQAFCRALTERHGLTDILDPA